MVIQGWTGMWIGLIRTEVGGNVNFSKNTAMDPSVVPGSDSSEVQTNVIAEISSATATLLLLR